LDRPLGQYDNSKLLNLGNNRWSFKPEELGISKAWGPWTFEVAPSVTIFSDNTNFFGGNTFAQSPIYAVQAHILYTFQSGVWMALDGIYFTGDHTTLNGVESDNEQRNTRAGFTLALSIDRQLAEVFRQHRHLNSYRQRIQCSRPRVAVSMGRGILKSGGGPSAAARSLTFACRQAEASLRYCGPWHTQSVPAGLRRNALHSKIPVSISWRPGQHRRAS
jgi:hypothetical protein